MICSEQQTVRFVLSPLPYTAGNEAGYDLFLAADSKVCSQSSHIPRDEAVSNTRRYLTRKPGDEVRHAYGPALSSVWVWWFYCVVLLNLPGWWTWEVKGQREENGSSVLMMSGPSCLCVHSVATI